MLALVHPYDPSPEPPHHHRATSSSSMHRQRPSHRKPSSSSSTSTSTTSSAAAAPRHPSSSSISSSMPSTSRTTSNSHHHQQQPLVATTTTSTTSTTSPTLPSTTSKAEPKPPTIDIHSYPPADLLRLLASLLSQIAAANDKLDSASASVASLAEARSTSSYAPHSPSEEHAPFWQTLFNASKIALSTPSSTLTFHARNIPTITLEAYLLRILKYCPTTNEVFLSLLVYFDRMSKLCSDSTGRTFVIDSFNIHRLVIAGVTVASKFFSDVFYTNSRYAKVGGLPLAELNQLELQFLLLNDFRLVIPKDEMQRYAEQLILFSTSPSSSSTDVTEPKLPTIRPPLVPNPTLPSTSTSNPSSTATPFSSTPSSSSGSSTITPGSSFTSISYTPPQQTASQPLQENSESRMHAMGAIDAYGGRIGGSGAVKPPGAYASFSTTTTPGTSVSMQREYSQRNGYPTPTAEDEYAPMTTTVKTPRRGSDASSVYSVSSSSEADTETETEAETETDGGWTTDDEPTIRPPGSVSAASFSDSDSVYGEGAGGRRASVASFDSVGTADDESEREDGEDGDSAMDFEDEVDGSGSGRIGKGGDVEMDVERTPDSERIFRRGAQSRST